MLSSAADWVYAARFTNHKNVDHKRARRQARARDKREWQRGPEAA